jgi:hypothetical protein
LLLQHELAWRMLARRGACRFLGAALYAQATHSPRRFRSSYRRKIGKTTELRKLHAEASPKKKKACISKPFS